MLAAHFIDFERGTVVTHAKLEEVTARVVARSETTRQAYLEKIRGAHRPGVSRRF